MNGSLSNLVCVLGVLVGPTLLGSSPSRAQETEVAGIITELTLGAGVVEVRSARSAEWRPAQPLLTLRPGDVIRITEDASGVVVLSDGRGSVRVGLAESPFFVPATTGDRSKAQRAVRLLQASLNYLSARAKDDFRAFLVTRGSVSPVILAPRNSRVLPGTVTVEWMGANGARYTVRILSPANVIMERNEVVGNTFAYPAGAPEFVPGTRYTIQVLAERQPPEEAWFEVLGPDPATVIRQDLIGLQGMLAPDTPPSSIAAIQAGFLLSERLPHDARLALLAALANDPGVSTLHLLLGDVYASVGLPELAGRSYATAQAFLSGGATPPMGKR